MADLCPLCRRPAVSDAAYWHRSEPVPPGACTRQGSPDCDDAREERERRKDLVVEAARRMMRHLARGGDLCTTDPRDRRIIRAAWSRAALADRDGLAAALRALDWEG